ncbi:hypothetical protein [Agarivorans sp. Toyoura001]|uniref:hypothetical protein n=1 Tax=unclassified Agarivorans TaxID=2636026 RepID=UPI0010DBD410|nr:hypothetical protein [Agarivorans sp. Toyoura001]GDY27385.1 hypothetical protein AHAT_32750 [Agarivorans sp. Toyoura001]
MLKLLKSLRSKRALQKQLQLLDVDPYLSAMLMKSITRNEWGKHSVATSHMNEAHAGIFSLHLIVIASRELAHLRRQWFGYKVFNELLAANALDLGYLDQQQTSTALNKMKCLQMPHYNIAKTVWGT